MMVLDDANFSKNESYSNTSTDTASDNYTVLKLDKCQHHPIIILQSLTPS